MLSDHVFRPSSVVHRPSNNHGGRRTADGRRHQIALVLCVLVLWAAPCEATGVLLAGVAKQYFELSEYVPLAGYSRRDGARSRGTHDVVGVRALVVAQGDTRIALVSCELLVIDERLFDAVRARLRDTSSAPLQLVLVATHTHSGPGAYGQKFLEKVSMGHFDPEVFRTLVRQITETILEAARRLEPVEVSYARGLTEGLIENRMEPDGLVENEVTVCVFRRRAGSVPLAVVVNFSAHATTLGAWNMELSGDYPGVVMRRLEARWPSAVCLFFPGAVGDQAPVKRGKLFEPAERIGEALAERVEALVAKARPATGAIVAVHHEILALPPAKLRLGAMSLPRWMSGWFVDDDATLTVVRIGEIVFAGFPCDLVAAMGREVKQAISAHALYPVILSFTNDYIGYCIPAALYMSEHYEALMAFNGPDTGELIVSRIIAMVEEISRADEGQGARGEGTVQGPGARGGGQGKGESEQ